MKCFRCYDIEWDVDDGDVDVNLPHEVYVPAGGMTLEGARDDGAADWLSDEYGYAVRSLCVEEAQAKMYTVYVRRVETYDLPVNVLAHDKKEAIEHVRFQNERAEQFEDTWMDLQPSVKSSYSAALSEQPDRGEGPLA